jgi:hypothetical protein
MNAHIYSLSLIQFPHQYSLNHRAIPSSARYTQKIQLSRTKALSTCLLLKTAHDAQNFQKKKNNQSCVQSSTNLTVTAHSTCAVVHQEIEIIVIKTTSVIRAALSLSSKHIEALSLYLSPSLSLSLHEG